MYSCYYVCNICSNFTYKLPVRSILLHSLKRKYSLTFVSFLVADQIFSTNCRSTAIACPHSCTPIHQSVRHLRTAFIYHWTLWQHYHFHAGRQECGSVERRTWTWIPLCAIEVYFNRFGMFPSILCILLTISNYCWIDFVLRSRSMGQQFDTPVGVG